MQSLLHCAALAEVSCRVDSLAGRCRDTRPVPPLSPPATSPLFPPFCLLYEGVSQCTETSSNLVKPPLQWRRRTKCKTSFIFKKNYWSIFFFFGKKAKPEGGGGGPRGVCQKGNFSGFFFGTLPLLDVSSQLAAMVITSTGRL